MFAGCLVETADRRILCQLRDDKPGIAFPGYWTCTPGGHVQDGERPLVAARRELDEEFEVKVRDLRPFSVSVRDAGKAAGVYHIFTAKLLSPESRLRCHEGQKASFLSADEALQLRQHPLSREALEQYLGRKQPKKKGIHGKHRRLRRDKKVGR